MGQLDRAREAFEAFYRQRQDSFAKLFELAGAYLRANQDDKAVEVLNQAKEWMRIVGRENEFAAQLDRMTTIFPNSIALAQLIAALYEELNREAKYFDSLVQAFRSVFRGREGEARVRCPRSPGGHRSLRLPQPGTHHEARRKSRSRIFEEHSFPRGQSRHDSDAP